MYPVEEYLKLLLLFNPDLFLKLFSYPPIKSSSDLINNCLTLSGILAIDFAELLLNTNDPKKNRKYYRNKDC